MKVLALNGSPHRKGNTLHALNTVIEELKKEKIRCEVVQLGKENFGPCKACGKCAKKQDGYCHGYKDNLGKLVDKIKEADGILMGSPVWFSAATSYLKNVIDRVGMVSRTAKTPFLPKKAGAAVTVARRAGCNPAFSEINYWFLINEMMVPGSSYWNVGYGRLPGEVLKDEEGMDTFKTLGKNMAWLLQKLDE